MFIGRKEFIDKVNDLEGKLNNQKIVNDMLMKKIADLTEKLDSVQSIMALNAIEKLMTAVAKAELGINLATQMTSKVVSAYTTIMNISI